MEWNGNGMEVEWHGIEMEWKRDGKAYNFFARTVCKMYSWKLKGYYPDYAHLYYKYTQLNNIV